MGSVQGTGVQGLQVAAPALNLQRNLGPEEIAQLLSDLYRQAGPKLGAKLIEPPFVLTLAQQRAETPWNGDIPEPSLDDLERFEALNRALEPRGYAFEVDRQDYLERGAFNFVSLVGLERVTEVTQIPGIPRYNAESGWEGRARWRESLRALPRPPGGDWQHILPGILLGYPDQAMRRFFVGPLSSGRPDYGQRRDLVSAYIPEARYYECALPEFDLSWQDIDRPEIRAKVENWGTLLRGIYAAPAHRALQAEPGFRHARLAHLRANDQQVHHTPAWSPERERWGLVGPERRLPLTSGTIDHERALSANIDQLSLGLCSRLSLEQLAARLVVPGKEMIVFNESTLMNWLAAGVDRHEGAAYRFYQVAEQHRPELLDGYVGECLKRLLNGRDGEDTFSTRFWLDDPIVRDRFGLVAPATRSQVMAHASRVLGSEEANRLAGVSN